MATTLEKQINLKQQGFHLYHASFHRDWAVRPGHLLRGQFNTAMSLTFIGVHGGILAAILEVADKEHFTTTLSAQNRPDLLSMHLEFLRTCFHDSFIITITDVKLGRGTSTIQMYLTQHESVSSQPLSQPQPPASTSRLFKIQPHQATGRLNPSPNHCPTGTGLKQTNAKRTG